MKKFYFLVLFAFAAFTAQAQVTAVVSVDMNDVSLADGDVVRLGGNFTDPMWTPTAHDLSDEDGDGVYVGTFEVDPGEEIQFKFVINDWGTNEFGDNMMFGDCTLEDGNRFATIPADESGFYILPTYVYNTCEVSALQVNTQDVSTISGVKFTPNPATAATLVTFENANNDLHTVSVASVTGQVVETLTTSGNNFTLNVADFAAGMYFVTFRNEKGEQGTERLMVK